MIERTGDGKGKCGIYEAASFPIAWWLIKSIKYLF
jgi:hypothetical protein